MKIKFVLFVIIFILGAFSLFAETQNASNTDSKFTNDRVMSDIERALSGATTPTDDETSEGKVPSASEPTKKSSFNISLDFGVGLGFMNLQDGGKNNIEDRGFKPDNKLFYDWEISAVSNFNDNPISASTEFRALKHEIKYTTAGDDKPVSYNLQQFYIGQGIIYSPIKNVVLGTSLGYVFGELIIKDDERSTKEKLDGGIGFKASATYNFKFVNVGLRYFFTYNDTQSHRLSTHTYGLYIRR